jgi:hypothetical protein
MNQMAILNSFEKLNLMMRVLKDPERKSLLRITYETISLLLIYRELPVHYFSRFLFKEDIRNIRDYLPNKFLANKIIPVFNDKNVKEVLDNKLYFDFYYRQFNVNLPTILMYNFKQMFVAGDKNVIVNDVREFTALLKETFKNNSDCDSILIKKTCASSGGANIFKLYPNQLQSDPETINKIYSKVISSGFLFQENVKQHPELMRLNHSCVNTIRMDTFIDRNGNISIVSGHIRMSIKNNHVDNIGSGGCFVSIDLQTGRLRKYGYSTIKNGFSKPLTQHPVTKTVFENFAIPFFNESRDLVLKTAACMPGLRLVGWDVAIGENGPLIIEGNSDYEIRGSDFADGGYLNNTTFRKVLHEIKYLH